MFYLATYIYKKKKYGTSLVYKKKLICVTLIAYDIKIKNKKKTRTYMIYIILFNKLRHPMYNIRFFFFHLNFSGTKRLSWIKIND